MTSQGLPLDPGLCRSRGWFAPGIVPRGYKSSAANVVWFDGGSAVVATRPMANQTLAWLERLEGARVGEARVELRYSTVLCYTYGKGMYCTVILGMLHAIFR